MSTTENPTPPSAPAGDPSDASAAPSPASATASSEAPTVPFVAATPAASVEPDAHASDASDAEESDAEGEGGEAAEGEVQAGEAGQTPGEGGEKKKRRRRRRKKKPGAQAQEGGEGAPREPGEAGAEGAAADGGATGDAQEHAEGETRAEGDKPGRGPRPKKPKVEKERPAFNVGDVVFGKVLDVTEDVLFIDLSGKGTALFDLRELLITEEDAKADMAAADDEHEPRDAAPTTEASPGAPTADQATSDPEPAGDDAALAAETPADATASAAEAPADVTANSAEPPADATEPTEAAVEAAAAPAVAAEPAPQLPRVILEPGAPFVGVVHNDGGRGGLVVLTHHPKRVRRAKPVVAAAFRDKSLVDAVARMTEWLRAHAYPRASVEAEPRPPQGQPSAPGVVRDIRIRVLDIRQEALVSSRIDGWPGSLPSPKSPAHPGDALTDDTVKAWKDELLAILWKSAYYRAQIRTESVAGDLVFFVAPGSPFDLKLDLLSEKEKARARARFTRTRQRCTPLGSPITAPPDARPKFSARTTRCCVPFFREMLA